MIARDGTITESLFAYQRTNFQEDPQKPVINQPAALSLLRPKLVAAKSVAKMMTLGGLCTAA